MQEMLVNRRVVRPAQFVQRLWMHCVLALLFSFSWAQVNAADEYLEPEAAFQFSARMQDAQTVAVKFGIADGYYMYRERFQFTAEGATLGAPAFPDGKVKFDETFQKNVETYRHEVTVLLPVVAAGQFKLMVSSQGCADAGLCYAPMASLATLSKSGGGIMAAIAGVANSDVSGMSTKTNGSSAVVTGGAESTDNSGLGGIETALKSGRLLTIVPLFLLLGLGLSFTPCVLPMVPILSSIIVGEGKGISRGRGFTLSLTYAFGMALVYTVLGVVAGLVGEGLAATLQNPWVLSAFALLMVALSLSMFGYYELQVPGAVQLRLMKISHHQAAGKLFGVFVMGALSALIVGPCVAAPLAGALVYISQTRNVVIGGGALFAMAVGMSVPLLLVGLSAGALLPRAGIWMDAVKRFFGVLMLGVALWMVGPVLPPALQMIGWAVLGIGYGAYLLGRSTVGWVFKAIGIAAGVLGLLQLVGVATGGRDALAPLGHLRSSTHKDLSFVRVKSTAQLDAMLAATTGKTVMLDFYADWCVSCKEMEKLTFSDERVQRQLANTVLLQVDVTANDADDRAMLKRFQLFGPPGIIFFDRQGREINGSRVIGYQNAPRFLQSLAVLDPT